MALSNIAATAVASAWFEARLATAKHEAAGTWDTKEGAAAEKVMGHLAMALEADGINLNDLEPAYRAYAEKEGK